MVFVDIVSNDRKKSELEWEIIKGLAQMFCTISREKGIHKKKREGINQLRNMITYNKNLTSIKKFGNKKRIIWN